MVYYNIEPFGEERADIRQAITSTLIANAFYTGSKPARPEDFMPFMEKDKTPQTWQQMKQLLKATAIKKNSH